MHAQCTDQTLQSPQVPFGWAVYCGPAGSSPGSHRAAAPARAIKPVCAFKLVWLLRIDRPGPRRAQRLSGGRRGTAVTVTVTQSRSRTCPAQPAAGDGLGDSEGRQ